MLINFSFSIAYKQLILSSIICVRCLCMMYCEFRVQGNCCKVCVVWIQFCYRIYLQSSNANKHGFVSLKFCCGYNCRKTENPENIDIGIVRCILLHKVLLNKDVSSVRLYNPFDCIFYVRNLSACFD
jgi:hypothetical protein